MHGAIALDQVIDLGIVQRAHDDRERMALEGMGECGEFPCAQMCGEKENSLALRECSLEVLETFIDDNPADVVTRVSREEADFGELASERNIGAAKNASAFALFHFRECEGEIPHANAA